MGQSRTRQLHHVSTVKTSSASHPQMELLWRPSCHLSSASHEAARTRITLTSPRASLSPYTHNDFSLYSSVVSCKAQSPHTHQDFPLYSIVSCMVLSPKHTHTHKDGSQCSLVASLQDTVSIHAQGFLQHSSAPQTSLLHNTRTQRVSSPSIEFQRHTVPHQALSVKAKDSRATSLVHGPQTTDAPHTEVTTRGNSHTYDNSTSDKIHSRRAEMKNKYTELPVEDPTRRHSRSHDNNMFSPPRRGSLPTDQPATTGSSQEKKREAAWCVCRQVCPWCPPCGGILCTAIAAQSHIAGNISILTRPWA